MRGDERATALAGRALTVRELLGAMNEHGTELREAAQVLLRGTRRTPEKVPDYVCRSLSQTARDGLCLVVERHTEFGRRWYVTGS